MSGEGLRDTLDDDDRGSFIEITDHVAPDETNSVENYSSAEECDLSVEERRETVHSSVAYSGDRTRRRKRINKQIIRPDDDLPAPLVITCSQCRRSVESVSIGTQTTTVESRGTGITTDQLQEPFDTGKVHEHAFDSSESRAAVASNHTNSVPNEDAVQPTNDSRISSSSSSSPCDAESPQLPESFLPTLGPPKILTFIGELPKPIAAKLDGGELNQGDAQSSYGDAATNGICQFCGNCLEGDAVEANAAQKFCCEKFRDFSLVCAKFKSAQEGFVDDEIIDVAPHPPHGTKAARKAAKERAAERMREREMEKQKAASTPSNFYSFSRQMKTIQFSLSSAKCMSEGWTIRPTSPEPEPLRDRGDSFLVDFNASQIQKKRKLYEKFYDAGQRFLTILPDGTGNVFYPSGDVAVSITSTSEGRFRYIVQESSSSINEDASGLLALFEPDGKACCYFPDGSLRMCLNSYGGIELSKKGARRKRWRWHFIKGHVHAPPFQPTVLSLSKNVSVRVAEQDNITLTFSCMKKTIKFNVGAKLKPLKTNKVQDFVMEAEEMFLQENKKLISLLINKMQLVLRFPKLVPVSGKLKSSAGGDPLILDQTHDTMATPTDQRPSVVIQ